MSKRIIRFGSNEAVYAPNIFKWAVNAYKFEDQREAAKNVLNSWTHSLEPNELHGILDGTIPFDVDENEAVVVILDN